MRQIDTGNHALIELLSRSGMTKLANGDNLRLFKTLKEALIKDTQSVVSYDSENHSLSAINPTLNLQQSQSDLLRLWLSSWALNVLKPFVDAINHFTTDDYTLTVDLDGYLADLTPYFREDGNIDVYQPELDIGEVAQYIDQEWIQDAKKLCRDWHYTLSVTKNGRRLAESIAALNNRGT